MREAGYAGAAERQARWLLWQMAGVEAVAEDGVHKPEEAATLYEPAAIPRSRYNAVIQRMKQAGQRTGAYSPWA